MLAASPSVACWQGVAGPPGDMHGNGKAEGKVRCSLFGRCMGGLFRALFLALDLKDLPLAPLYSVDRDRVPNLLFLIPYIVHAQLALLILGVLEVASSDVSSTTPALPRLPLPCWTWHFAPVKPRTFSPFSLFACGRDRYSHTCKA